MSDLVWYLQYDRSSDADDVGQRSQGLRLSTEFQEPSQPQWLELANGKEISNNCQSKKKVWDNLEMKIPVFFLNFWFEMKIVLCFIRKS